MQNELPEHQNMIDFKKARIKISMEQVLSALNFNPNFRRGEQLRGKCPILESKNLKSKSFSVNLSKHAFNCFGCGAKGNQLDLYSHATGKPLYEATKELLERFSLPNVDDGRKNLPTNSHGIGGTSS